MHGFHTRSRSGTPRARRGFTLVEIMMVVAIISVIAAIAIPSAIRYRMQAREAQALGVVRQYQVAQTQWRSGAGNGGYGGLMDLTGPGPEGGPPYLSSVVVEPEYSASSGNSHVDVWVMAQYRFVSLATEPTPYTDATFMLYALPLMETRSFFTDASGAIRWATSPTIANAWSPVLP